MASPIAKKNSKAVFINLLQALIKAITTELPNVQSFTFNGQTITRANLLAALQAYIDAAADTAAANQSWRVKVTAEKAARVEAASLVGGMKTYVETTYGKSSPELLKFGFTPVVPPVRTVASKVVSVTKGAATRALRNPLTSAEKKTLKASVGGSIEIPTHEPKPVVPPAAGVAPSPAPTGRSSSGS
jgi:hypothetical protein